MKYKTVLEVLVIALCAAVALSTTSTAIGRPGTGLPSTLDVAVQITSPRDTEKLWFIPVQISLINVGDTAALVPRLSVEIRTSGYSDFQEGFSIGVGDSTVATFLTWVPMYSEETCTAWITYAEDMNHHNDTDVVIVQIGPFPGVREDAGTRVSPSPSQLTGSIARASGFVSHTGPLNVTLFDIKGRAVVASRLGAARAGKSCLDLRGLRSGVYLARLNDGRRSSFQKLVVQR